MKIQHNISALNTKNKLSSNDKKIEKALKNLSSGYRVNSAADDAAGLAISEKMRALITGADRAEANIQDGISLVQVADGAMEEIHQMLNRGVELSSQAANGIYSPQERQSLQDELDSLKDEINRITESTNFNGIDILKGNQKLITSSQVKTDGTLPGWVNAGTSVANGYMDGIFQTVEDYEIPGPPPTTQSYTIDHAAARFDFSAYDGSAVMKDDLKAGGFYFTCCTCSSHYSVKFTDGTGSSVSESGNHKIYSLGIDNISTAEDLVDAIAKAMNNGNPNGHYTNVVKDPAAPETLIVYDDRSKNPEPPAATGGNWVGWSNPEFSVTANTTQGMVGEGVATAVTTTTGNPDMVLMIGTNSSDTMWLDLPNTVPAELGIGGLSLLTENGSRIAMDTLKQTINYISQERGRMGGYQNRLEHTLANMQVYSENMTQAESTIRDADMAREYSELTKNQVLSQAATAMLSQANQQPQRVLELLG